MFEHTEHDAKSSHALMEISDVSKIFTTKHATLPAVDGVNLTVNAGEVLCLVGESGCGKTTTARMAAGLSKPTAGTISYDGQDIWSLDKAGFGNFRTAVQYVHQDPYASLNPIRTVEATLTAPLRKHGLAKNGKEAWEQATQLLRRVNLTPPENYLSKFPHQLSGGQRQRVAVARALSLDPKLIIADESTSMLDVSIRVAMLNMLGSLRDDLGVGFLFITHDLAIAKYFGWQGRTAVMYLGKVVEYGPTPEVINNPQHPYTRALLDAVPEPDPDAAARKLEGGGLKSAEIPSLANLPSGCSFHPRCPIAEDGLCDVKEPALAPVARRSVSCHVVQREDGHPGDRIRPPEPAGATSTS
ncbi:peptide/nickel transport system ATP-binding protein [Friedmanniella endophytica]|uniref:Peptide/nickel transport system ATP-binding protein n=1 Tax=Microlunatus kandeliicorticis TaxID=1759536 RepID=A0A7W3IUA8_9ACTN|nr:ABC transporter ATP-binding protein [Microlunatus kandeliicorticis]MBA8795363.1 peptide/nickel transport system ATP-binding protein [Microlunatus kandeliicorticis]